MTEKKQRALAALLTSPSRAAAATAAGVTTRTLQNYLADPEFQAEYKQAFEGMVKDAAQQAKQSLAPALSTLREITEDKDEDAQARIGAARAILSHGLKLIEITDVLARLDELEREVSNGKC